MIALLTTTLAVSLVAMCLLWLLSLGLRDASIVDPWWGPGFGLIAVVAFFLADGWEGRRWLLTGMAVVWGLRLGLFLLWRNHGKGEDYRYRDMRSRSGSSFWWASLFKVFLLQGVMMWIISAPLQLGQMAGTPDFFTWLDGLGLAVWGLGLFFEAVGDWQMARFKADPTNAGEVMDRGLWRYTRHPNYFGDTCVWWGHWLVAAATPLGAFTIFAPALMTFLIVRVSGVALLEEGLEKKKPAYREYVRRTSAFIPMPPKPKD